ncbi:DUF805 domain-containing protein [Halomonas sp. ML-15]|uniref:DUF805 domain-containing protein n=1 Tax=Halomonas sp. ML-15 TaxID=2773305 RepID=UPI0017460BDE|nr:DUF805 domain-containing protein [Halomonas sp. ML-15]MBD3897781.1 DUF805 domain-containing protein [Halomonas sp. ML-15]
MTASEPCKAAGERESGSVWRGFFQSRGRLGRGRFLLFSLTLLLFWVLSGTLSNWLWSRYYLLYGEMLSLTMIAISLMVIVIGMFHGARRFNDFGASGWWMLLYLVFPILFLALVLVPGSSGDNRFGRAPADNPMKVAAMMLLVTLGTAFLLLLLVLV